MQDNLISIMLEHRVGGILVFLSPDSSIKSITQIKRLGIPLVLINRRLDKALCDFIGIDNVKGGQMVTEYLIKKGHRRIAFLGGLSNLPVWQDRKNGYEKALRLSGLEIDNSLIMESLPVRESGSELMKKILLHPNPPTAAFCFNDTIAVGAMMALKEKGLAPGYDMAIVGFDDTLEGQAFIPKLTTVYAFPRVIGVKALNLLKARIDGLDSEIQNIILEPELIVRESCSYKTDL
jgi:LacI family transcriptional regulator